MNDKMAKVVEITMDGSVKVKFDGEDTESRKTYPYLDSYKPVVGDRVFMCRYNNSYIIFGKVVK